MAQPPKPKARGRKKPSTKARSASRATRKAKRPPKNERFEPTLAGARKAARGWFGIHRLHPEQEQAMEAVLAGRDTLVVLPTGYGKSLIYQVPALLLDRPTLVISPLIALMRDQERALRARGVPVVRLDSTLKAAARRQALQRLEKGGRLIVLTTPETLESEKTRPSLQKARPLLLCVDESHCISEWGHDFRPAYLRIGIERARLDVPTTLALTATATPKVRADIAERLRMADPAEVIAPPHRRNLRLGVDIVPGNLKIERTAKLLKRLRRPGILYCATTKAVDEIYGALTRARIPCTRYHGGMKTNLRNNAQRKFMKGDRRLVMAATSAFGMGIDKPDIRYIVHYQAPGSLEQYVQEAGRAGRDGKPSDCILLFDPADLEIQAYLQKQGRPSPAQLRRVAHAAAAWAAEDKAPTAKDLAVSAQIPATTCRALCAQLEDLGLLERDPEKRYVARVPPEALREGAEDLAQRYETMRREDDRRLRSIAEYAETPECRSVFIRRYFGEPDPPPCGKCDRCRERHRLEDATRRVRKQSR
ncbi:MAG: RecQ family ATP-dependent DNA helicase [Myxococcota bacterium]